MTSDNPPYPATDLPWLRPLVLVTLIATAIYFVTVSWHWRLAIDGPVMHYVVFLLRHGLKPYSQISDNNFPGAYLTEALGMRIFGMSDVGWRIYEFTLLGIMTLALARLARGWDWTAGVFASWSFIVLHANEGPQYSGERELVLTVLLLLAYLALFAAVDRVEPLWMLPFGLLSGLAASIKPTYFPLPIAICALALVVLHRRRQAVTLPLLYAIAGLGIVFGGVVLYLVHEGVLHDFLFVTRSVTPAYLSLTKTVTNRELLRFSLPKSGFLLVAACLPLVILNWRRDGAWSWKQWSFLLGAAFGLTSYLVQHKGFSHHRYTLFVFVDLLCSIELFRAVRGQTWSRAYAVGVILLAIAASPHALAVSSTWSNASDLELSLEQDLNRLGGASALDGKVQCFDLVYGCLSALYHERIVDRTGFTGDLLFFSKSAGPATQYYRRRYWQSQQTHPTTVLVVSNEDLMSKNNYERLDRWPEFADYLKKDFVLVEERRFPKEMYGTHPRAGDSTVVADQDGYRLYLRRGSQAIARWGTQ